MGLENFSPDEQIEQEKPSEKEVPNVEELIPEVDEVAPKIDETIENLREDSDVPLRVRGNEVVADREELPVGLAAIFIEMMRSELKNNL